MVINIDSRHSMIVKITICGKKIVVIVFSSYVFTYTSGENCLCLIACKCQLKHVLQVLFYTYGNIWLSKMPKTLFNSTCACIHLIVMFWTCVLCKLVTGFCVCRCCLGQSCVIHVCHSITTTGHLIQCSYFTISWTIHEWTPCLHVPLCQSICGRRLCQIILWMPQLWLIVA